ncbi:bifunctional DNA primase/polymerase [Mycolicibacter sinensis]|uniref:bifunctional DNA primase/polymerase n=1 Tax=Mycolicibacter sinensis (strain JDM601) TaxID=875328 RepID=UPI0007EB8AAF|nr:bifunctional DNA primase/polymerase [Mycolicibacter sinensis]OBH20822.1 hypothetical protein A5694_15160 [Mycolicibacter sinensis]
MKSGNPAGQGGASKGDNTNGSSRNTNGANDETPAVAGYADAVPVYLEAGWAPIPLPTGQKWPPPRGATGRGNPLPSAADCHAWADDPRHAGGNTALRMPPTVVGIDVDDYGDKPGAATLAGWEFSWGQRPATWRSSSRGTDTVSGIYYYRIPAGVELDSNPDKGVEIVQHHHRYAVVAPSQHPDTGSRYRWYDPAGQVCGPPRVDQLPELPAAWLDGLQAAKHGDRDQQPSAAPPSAVAGGDRLRRYALNVLEREAAELAGMAPETGRNNKLNDAALRCYRLADGAGMDRAIVTATLRAAAQQSGTPGIEGTLRSAATKADADGPAYPPDNDTRGDWDPGSTDVGDLGDGSGDDERPRYTDFAALLNAGLPDPPQPEFLARVDGVPIFYRGKRNELYGDPEDGKTMIALAAIAERLTAGGRALFLDLDNNGAVETARRLVMLGAPLDAITDPDKFRHIEPADEEELRGAVDDCTGWAEIALIDCAGELIPLFGGSSDSADDYTAIMRRTSGKLERAGAAVILIDHPAKGRESRAYGAGGTMAKRRAVNGVSINVVRRQTFAPGQGGAADLWINKDRPGGLRQHCTNGEGRRQFAGTFTLDPPDPDTGVAAWRVTTDTPASSTTTLDPVVERHYDAAVKLAGTTTGATVAEVAAIANGLPPGTPATRSQKETARRALDKLQFEHRLVLVDGASPKRWELPE